MAKLHFVCCILLYFLFLVCSIYFCFRSGSLVDLQKTKKVVLFLTAIIHVISWTSRWLLWEPLADWRMKGHKSWNTSEKKKFSMACTSAMFFIIASIAGWRVFSVQEWLWDPDRWNENLYLDRTLDAAFKFHYLLYAARFSSDFLSIFFEERRFVRFVSPTTTRMAPKHALPFQNKRLASSAETIGRAPSMTCT